uniref:Secreted protein n=1 Tax=Anguilla anguilla TaxID=7936 RepID=A0A0E9QGD9_ANGAN
MLLVTRLSQMFVVVPITAVCTCKSFTLPWRLNLAPNANHRLESFSKLMEAGRWAVCNISYIKPSFPYA